MRKTTAMVWLLTLLGAGCHDKPQAPALSASARKPPDQLAPGELPEGRDDAFGLPLPDAMRVTTREQTRIVAEGSLSPEQVANYVRARVKGGAIEVGPTKTIFRDVSMISPRRPFKGTITIDLHGSERYTAIHIYANEIIVIPRTGLRPGASVSTPQ